MRERMRLVDSLFDQNSGFRSENSDHYYIFLTFKMDSIQSRGSIHREHSIVPAMKTVDL